ncbi:MAG: DUF2079 domain-containing protein [Clostridia bacterium]|nr:DUF2079 domain-containing protein [Clostridia bacterium]
MKRIFVFLKKNQASFSAERIVCRILASACTLWAYGLWQDSGFLQLSYRQETSAASVCLYVGILWIAYTCFSVILQPYETDSWFLIAGAGVCVIRWITVYDDFLFSLSVILVYSLFVFYFICKNELLWQKWNPGKKTVWCAAIACGLCCGAVIATITCIRYLTFSAPNFDFGIFVNMLHHMRESGEPLCTCERDVPMSHFAVHLSPIWYALLPFYAVFPSPLTLQIGQAAVVASGVIPVTLLCRARRLSGKLTMLTAIIYCFYPALTTGCFFDIHENCFLAPLLLWTFYFFEKRRYAGMYVFALLTLSVKEDAAVYVLFFALYLFFSKRQRRHGIALAIGAVAYFSVAMSILRGSAAHYAELYASASPNPAIGGPMVNRYGNFIYDPDEGLKSAVKTVLLNPGYLLSQIFSAPSNDWGKLLYFLKLLLPVGFLPFFTNRHARWILLAPVLLNLATDYPYQYHLNYQYHFGISAFLIYAAVLNLSDMPSSFRRAAASIAATACCCLYLTAVYPSLRANVRNFNENRDQYARMDSILQTIPSDASVCCSTYLLPHLADRDEIYEIYYHGGEGDVDYVIFDARYPIDKKQINAFLRQGYVIRDQYENLLIIMVKEKNS